jgi:hypothetical protein
MIETGIPPEWKEQWEQVLEQLEDPLKLKLVALGIILLAGFLLVYRPLDVEIVALRRQLAEQEGRSDTIRKVDSAQATWRHLMKPIPPQGDVNFWTEYILAAVRDSGVSLRTLESEVKKVKIGNLQAVYFRVEVGGPYHQVYDLVERLETGEWYTRIIRMRLKKKPKSVESTITVNVLASIGKKDA